jgi:hypothetical protein
LLLFDGGGVRFAQSDEAAFAFLEGEHSDRGGWRGASVCRLYGLLANGGALWRLFGSSFWNDLIVLDI